MNELSLFSESMNGAQSTDMEQSVKALSSSNNLNNVEVSCDEVDEIISIMLRFLVMRLTRSTLLTSSMTTAPVSLPCMWVLMPSTITET